MLTLLIATDGSAYSDHAIEYAVRRAARSSEPVHAHLLNVQVPLQGVNVKLFISPDSLESYYRDEGMTVLQPVRARLETAGLGCELHIGVGDAGEVIVAYADHLCCDEIVMGTHGRGMLGGAVMGSVAQKVIQQALVPVVLVK
jgi:nucleotide-binding universal stress UspA family protein